MFRRCLAAVVLVLGVASGLSAVAAGEPKDKTRTFQFTYSTTLTGLPAGKTVRIWLPVPPSNEDQDVKVLAKELPAPGTIGKEPKYGNESLHVEAKVPASGSLALSVTYLVTRREVSEREDKTSTSAAQFEQFLKPDAKVPVGGKPLELLKGKTVPMDKMAAARLLYDVVNNHMRYSKEGIGWGQGDSIWACDSGFGNCSDFHSLFISLARAQHIPTKFEMGFPLPEKHGAGEIPGYHCWAKFWVASKGWVPVDISEANKNPGLKDYYFGHLSPDRIAFSTGRDIDLVPKQAGAALNFFVYPYAEVDGKPVDAGKVRKQFTFKDVAK